MVLLEELRHVHDEVADHRQARQRPQRHRLFEIREARDAGEPVLAVDVHCIRSADALSTRASERKRIVLLLDANERIEQHAIGGLQVDVVVLHVGLRVFLGVIAVDFESHRFALSNLNREEDAESRKGCTRKLNSFWAFCALCAFALRLGFCLNRSAPSARTSPRSAAANAPACTRAGCLPCTTVCASTSLHRPACGNQRGHARRGFPCALPLKSSSPAPLRSNSALPAPLPARC